MAPPTEKTKPAEDKVHAFYEAYVLLFSETLDAMAKFD